MSKTEQDEIIHGIAADLQKQNKLYLNAFGVLNFVMAGLYLLAAVTLLADRPLFQSGSVPSSAALTFYLLACAGCVLSPGYHLDHIPVVYQPLAKYVPTVLTAFPLAAMLSAFGIPSTETLIMWCAPLGVVLLQWYAMGMMSEMDVQLQNLEGLKYKYKGA
ncbi:hypothetical protein BC832DRAFT_104464 [Gaertneriomyces semiglobifer]|nr:hypothetical protein BC832DRAFT_104464 [Gaertneriomyces semiglobifer]